MTEWARTFEQLLERRTGIRLSPSIRDRVTAILQARADTLGFPSIEGYLRSLEHSTNSGELQTLTNLITVGKTSFYRYPNQIRAIVERVIPALDDTLGQDQTIGIWSAGCSTGEEPYTLAMALAHAGWSARRRFRYLATDINTAALERARGAHYPRQAYDNLPPFIASYCQRGSGSGITVSPEIRRQISFERLNLIEDPYPDPGQWHIVLCANVLIYFSQATVEATVERIGDALADNAILMLGGSESLNAFSVRRPFALLRMYDSYGYAQGPWSETIASAPERSDRPQPVSAAPTAAEPALTPEPQSPRPRDSHAVAQALALAERGLRQEAIAALENLSAEDAKVDRQLGLLYFAERRYDDARECIEDALNDDPLAFDLYFYLGWLNAALGERGAAMEALRRALFIEPGFSFARYEFARMLHLRGEYAAAVREYLRAERSAQDPRLRERLRQRAAGSTETFWFDDSFIIELCAANRERAQREEQPVVGAPPTGADRGERD